MNRVTVALVALLLAISGGFWAGHSWRGKEVAELKRAQAESIQAATQAALRAHAAKTHRIQEAQDAEFDRRKTAEAALRRSDAAGRGLRVELETTKLWLAGAHASLAHEREAARKTVSLLSGLLERCSEERRAIAKFADDAAGAGTTCEHAWPKE